MKKKRRVLSAFNCTCGGPLGYYDNGQCKACHQAQMREARRLHRLQNPPKPGGRGSPICPQGHDKRAVGARKDNSCVACFNARQRKAYKKRQRKIKGSARKCKRGHGAVVGKNCLKCESERKLRAGDNVSEKQRARNKAWYAANPDRGKAASRRWQLAHPEKMQVIRSNRYAAKRGAVGEITDAEWTAILVKYEYHCAYCGKQSDSLQQDHVIPIQGEGVRGPHYAFNIVPACLKCNVAKSNRIAPGTQHTLFDIFTAM